MSNESDNGDDPPSHLRRVTNKQIMGIGAMSAGLVLVNQLSSVYLTNDKADVIRNEMRSLKDSVSEMKMTTLPSMKSDILSAFRESEARHVSNDDRLERRIDRNTSRQDGYESAMLNRLTKKSTN